MLAAPAALDALVGIARDLTAALAAEDRYARLLAALREVIPYDAACLLRVEGDALVPLAGYGLAPAALRRSYRRREHPRLDAILGAREPVVFPDDSPLPDPFDGLVHGAPEHAVHACLGCPLVAGGVVVGALTADALEPGRFARLPAHLLAAAGALAGAALQTASLIEALERTAERRGRVARELQSALAGGGELLGSSEAARRLLAEVELVARSDLPVLVTGETGVGKELVARRVHELSARRREAMIQVNCAALPEAIAESELFGHVAGAFTGAIRERAGKLEVADGGTLFLDEVGELAPALQPKLLRALQEGEVQRVGADRPLRVNVRVIAATNRDLEREVAAGRFRADLYHRLAAFPIRVPPLRERRDDIAALATHFVALARRRLGGGPVRLTAEALARLTAADWPGNVRELDNVVSRGVLRANAERRGDEPAAVCVRHLDLGGAPAAATAAHGAAPGAAAAALVGRAAPADDGAERGGALAERVDAFRRGEILAAVARHGGNWAAAARELGMHRGNLHHLARRLGLR